jgi:hypothetical protein
MAVLLRYSQSSSCRNPLVSIDGLLKAGVACSVRFNRDCGVPHRTDEPVPKERYVLVQLQVRGPSKAGKSRGIACRFKECIMLMNLSRELCSRDRSSVQNVVPEAVKLLRHSMTRRNGSRRRVPLNSRDRALGPNRMGVS